MVKITFYGGVCEIGGNKVLIEDGDTKILLDFGKSFTAERQWFNGRLKPRSTTALKDYFEFNLLPKINGLYSEEELEPTEIPYVNPEIHAVFISHAHQDHVEHLSLIDPKIPVYLSSTSKRFLEAAETTTPGIDYGKREYRPFTSNAPIQVNGLTVEPMPVDHSIFGACGFLIHTTEGTIVYTGDMRLQGMQSQITADFIAKAAAEKPIALVTEGTRMLTKDPRQSLTESQVGQQATKLAQTDRLVMFTQYSKDVCRLNTFYNVAKNAGRTLVISAKTAYLLTTLQPEKTLCAFDPMTDPNVRVYFRKKKGGTYGDKDYYCWERPYMANMVTEEFVRQNRQAILLNLDVQHFAELVDIQPENNSHFIYSMSEPFSEEDIEEHLLHNWLKHFGVNYYQCHASGHMSRAQLEKTVQTIAAKTVFPIHTQNPQMFMKLGKNVINVQTGKTYQL